MLEGLRVKGIRAWETGVEGQRGGVGVDLAEEWDVGEAGGKGRVGGSRRRWGMVVEGCVGGKRVRGL